MKFSVKLIVIFLILACSLTYVSCASESEPFNKYEGYSCRHIYPQGYITAQAYNPLSEGTFEQLNQYYTEEGAKLIIKVKTSSKTVTVDRGLPSDKESLDIYTCPGFVLTQATVTEIFSVTSEFKYNITVGDNIWLASEYIVDEKHKLIFVPGAGYNFYKTSSVLILPDSEYLLFATPALLHGEYLYKDIPILKSRGEGTIALGYSSWTEYANIISANGYFPHHAEFSDIWDDAIDYYIK